MVKEIQVQEGTKVSIGDLIFTLEGATSAPPRQKSAAQPVEYLSGQQAARLSFQAAILAEGKTEEQALPRTHVAGRLRLVHARAT